MASLERAGHLSDVIGCALALADIRLAQGRLGDALRIFERGLTLATGQGGPVLRGAADMHVGISTILRERGEAVIHLGIGEPKNKTPFPAMLSAAAKLRGEA